MKVLYILMRTDIQSMSPGRAMAQASHASNAFIKTYGHRVEVKAWQEETQQGFGTVIVLAATYLDIKNIEFCLKRGFKNIALSDVVDPDYKLIIPIELADLINKGHSAYNDMDVVDDKSLTLSVKQITCSYIFGEKETLVPYLSMLKLHP